ncbi:MAG: hypothetical protein KJO40_08205 [Deltaproteobacteria bacterium]|nr:hypothetical protein [Deltaproteobacteria bacterium]NNK09052.1 hypothetical protein [Myxococcales bacterium]RZV49453.1 MAG: hypothetical protein EX268_19055 [Deltaproteobacteria bacterium]
MKKIILGACLLASLAAIGCKKNKTSPPPPELSVRLVDPGEAPLEPLRYAIPPDTVVKSLLDIRDVDVAAEETEDSEDAFGVLPGFTLFLHAGPSLVLPKGFRYILRISKAESVLPEGVTDRQAQEAEQGVEALRGMRGRFDINAQGIVLDADVPWAQGQQRIHPRVAITIGNVRSAIATIPLPLEPVGIGAVWEVRRPLRIWSARVTQVTRYELTDRVGDRFRVTVMVQQTATPQVADLNPQLEMHVRSYEMHARGHALADLGLPLALEASLEASSAADIALVSPEKTEPLMSARRSVLRLASKKER